MTALPPDTPDRDLARFARGGLLSVAGSLVSSMAGIALVAVVTNGFARDQAGTLFAATSVWVIITAITQLGTEIGLVRHLPTLRATGRHSETTGLLLIALLPVLIAAALAGLGLFLVAEPASRHLVGEAAADDAAVMLQCLAAAVPVGAIYTSVLAATRGLSGMRTTVVADALVRSIGQPVAVLGVALGGGGALALVLAWLAPYALALLGAGAALALQTRRAVRRGAAPRTDSHDAVAAPDPGAAGLVATSAARDGLARDFWRFTGPRAIATVSQAALKRIDIVLVAALRSPAEAAVYTAATRFVVLGQLAVQSLQQALGPQLSLLFARGDLPGARRVFQTATAWMMLPSWPVYLVCAAVAPLILSLFGDGYAAGQPVIVILALAMLFATACGSVDTVLLMSGRSWLSLFNNVAALVVNVALNLLLIPPYGLVGAAVSWAAAILVRNALPAAQIRHWLGLSPGGPGAVTVALGALACFGVPGLALAFAPVPGWVALGLLVGLGGGAYVAVLWRRGETLHLSLLAATLRTRARRRGGTGAVTADGTRTPR